MDKLTHDLPSVVVYLDDILVGGISADEHIRNLRLLFQRLRDKGLRCNRNKCSFANESVEYLGHTISRLGISPGAKIDAVATMPRPENVSLLKSFLGSVQFYQKFLPGLATIAEPLYRLTRKNERWNWTLNQENAFQNLKKLLGSNVMLSHFDKQLTVGIACDASEVGIGAVLFHRFPDGTERPIFNVSKTLSEAQKKYSQIHKEGAFTGDEFQGYMKERGIQHLTGAPYHPATNGQAERFIQTFKRSMSKASLPVDDALQEFLMQYRRTPLDTGQSPSQLLHGRQIRTKVDALRPIYQEEKGQQNSSRYPIGQPCYIKYYGPRRDRQLRWVPATIFRKLGRRHVLVKSVPQGMMWKRHLEQIRPRYGQIRIMIQAI